MTGDADHIFSYPMFRDLEREQTVFTGIAGHRSFDANLAHGGQTTSSQGTLVSGSYFPVLGLQPAIGRLFTPDDDRTPGGHPVVVLAYDHWRIRFDESPAILNDTLIVNGEAMTVVGVAPRGFHGTTVGEPSDVFVPLTMSAPMRGRDNLDNRRSYWVYLFARLSPGVSINAARTGINVPFVAIINDVELALQQGSSDRTLERFAAKQIDLVAGARGQSELHREAVAPLFLLIGVTGVVLLIACVNIANLLLAKTAERAGEMAVRLSMGATRGQLIRQLLAESLLLAGVGGLGGLLVANPYCSTTRVSSITVWPSLTLRCPSPRSSSRSVPNRGPSSRFSVRSNPRVGGGVPGSTRASHSIPASLSSPRSKFPYALVPRIV